MHDSFSDINTSWVLLKQYSSIKYTSIYNNRQFKLIPMFNIIASGDH